MNNGKIPSTIISSITALICCAAVAITGTSITSKICDNQKEVAQVMAQSAGTQGGSSTAGTDAGFVDNGTAADAGIVDDGTGAVADGTAADATTPAGDTSGTGTASQSSTGSSSTGTGTAAKVITATSGLNSSDVNEVLQYYKLVAAKNAKRQSYVTKMTLADLKGGEGVVGKLLDFIKPIGVKALEKNSTSGENIPGVPAQIKASDWKAAKAENDGTYTTLTITVNNQTDGVNGKTNEGTVGRSIGVLDGIQTAIDEMDGVSADFSKGTAVINYTNAYIKVKVKNSTGEFVKGKCEWHHQVNVTLDNCTVKASILSATLKGTKVVVDYKVTY